MLLIAEDGTGVVGANSYATRVQADAYFDNHPFFTEQWFDLEPLKKDNLLIAATSQLDNLFNWHGTPSYREQNLGWPRYGVLPPNNQLGYRVAQAYQARAYDARNYYLSNVLIPDSVKKATYEMAFYLSKGDPFKLQSSRGLETLKIDVIELHFDKSITPLPVPAPALALLRGLGEYAFGARVRKVIVG